LPFALATGSSEDARRGFLSGEVILGTALAHRLGLGVGDTVTLDTRQGPRPLRIAGTTVEYTVGGMILYMEWNQGKKLFDLRGVHVFTVIAQQGATAELAPRMLAFCNERGLRCQSNADFRALLDRSIQGVAGIYWGLVILVFVVSSLGIVNTLTMNVLEQTRELGVLRAIAMKRGQMRKLILAQALALGVMSLLPGIAIGVGLAYMMNRGTHPVLGIDMPFHLSAGLVGGCFLAALAIVLLAAYFPARRAARIQVIRALQYE
jgi:putative ABC transport system permease protein